jgi:hypothetical protein
MIDPSLIAATSKRCAALQVYLCWDRHSALADYLLREYGLEVPHDFALPRVEHLEPVKNSVCSWPERIVIERTDAQQEVS